MRPESRIQRPLLAIAPTTTSPAHRCPYAVEIGAISVVLSRGESFPRRVRMPVVRRDNNDLFLYLPRRHTAFCCCRGRVRLKGQPEMAGEGRRVGREGSGVRNVSQKSDFKE